MVAAPLSRSPSNSERERRRKKNGNENEKKKKKRTLEYMYINIKCSVKKKEIKKTFNNTVKVNSSADQPSVRL